MAYIKEIKRLRGGDLQVAARANVRIDAEIGQKDHFRMETSVDPAPLPGQPEALAKPSQIAFRVWDLAKNQAKEYNRQGRKDKVKSGGIETVDVHGRRSYIEFRPEQRAFSRASGGAAP